MKKILLNGGIALLTIPSLIYYIAKYYIEKTLSFKQSIFWAFVIICSLIIFGLLLNVYNAYQNFILCKQNKELNNRINELKDFIEKCHY